MRWISRRWEIKNDKLLIIILLGKGRAFVNINICNRFERNTTILTLMMWCYMNYEFCFPRANFIFFYFNHFENVKQLLINSAFVWNIIKYEQFICFSADDVAANVWNAIKKTHWMYEFLHLLREFLQVIVLLFVFLDQKPYRYLNNTLQSCYFDV